MDDTDLMYTINWSRRYSFAPYYTCYRDYDNDGVNDVLVLKEGGLGAEGIEIKGIEVVDPIENKTLFSYVTNDSTWLYAYAEVGDNNNNNYTEITLVYVNDTAVKIVLLEPAMKTVYYEETYKVNFTGRIIFIDPYNIVYNYYNNTIEVAIASTQDYFREDKTITQLFVFNVLNGKLIEHRVFPGTLYTLWRNIIPVDKNNDGLLELDTTDFTVKAFFNLSNGPPVISVENLNGTWGWSQEVRFKDYPYYYYPYIPVQVITYYTTVKPLILVSCNPYPWLATWGSDLVIAAYNLCNGTLDYFIGYRGAADIDGVAVTGKHLLLGICDRLSEMIRVDVYNPYTGALMEKINLTRISRGEYIASITSIGDYNGDKINDFLVGVGTKLYLVTVNGEIDYLGRLSGEIVPSTMNTVINGETRFYTIMSFINFHTFRLYAISLTGNTTRTIRITVTKPVNNTAVEPPFTVEALIQGEPPVTPVVEIYNGPYLLFRAELDRIGDNLFQANITLPDIAGPRPRVLENTCILIVRTGDYSSKPLTIIVDEKPPEIITYPDMPVIYVRDKLLIKIEAVDKSLYSIEVKLNNTIIASATSTPPRYSIEETIDLTNYPDGKYCLEITAIDKLGHATNKTIIIYKDATPPEISIKTPGTMAVGGITVLGREFYRKQCPIELRLKDNTGLDTVIILSNNKIVERRKLSGTEETIVFKPVLKPGFNNIKVIVFDKIGNKNEVNKTLFLNTQNPVIKELDVKTMGLNIWYKVRVESANNIAVLDRVAVKIYEIKQGVPVSIYSKEQGYLGVGEYVVEGETVAPREGKYLIKIIVYDVSGNNATSSMIVTVDTTPPILSIEEAKLEDHTYIVKWNVSDNLSGIKQVILYVDGEPVDVTGRTMYIIELGPGTHNITITAIDNNGNKAVKQLPQITIEEKNLIEEIKKNPILLAIAAILPALIILAIYRVKSK